MEMSYAITNDKNVVEVGDYVFCYRLNKNAFQIKSVKNHGRKAKLLLQSEKTNKTFEDIAALDCYLAMHTTWIKENYEKDKRNNTH
jgi:hypothetical protein